MNNLSFLVKKKNIYQFNIGETALVDLQRGEIRVRIDLYAFTTNNITYAVSGFILRYWEFFPTKDPFGIIPVWGYADVVDSKHDQIKVGQRCYGYFPMSTYCTLQPVNVNPFTFTDGSPHRQELAAIYNYYTLITSNSILHKKELQNYVPIIHPLFTTSFMLYQFLKNQDFIGAEQVIITSASAKTSLGLAYILSQHKTQDGKKIIGLTSEGNIDFVRSTNYYDEVFTYDNYKSISQEKKVVIDIRGNRNFLIKLSNDFSEQIVHIARVGATDWTKGGKHSDIPKAELFFAPVPIKAFFKQHGPAKALQLMNEASLQFIQDTKKMMELKLITDIEQFSAIYINMVNGEVNPQQGYLVKIK